MFLKSKIRRFLPKKSIARVLIALILALLTLLISVQVTIRMTRTRMESYAEAESQQKSEYINSITNMIFMSNEYVINSFLAGFTDLEYYQDSVTHQSKFRYVLSDESCKILTSKDIYDKLESFLAYNSDFASVVMVFEPNVIKHIPKGIAAARSVNDTINYDLLVDNDVFNSMLYQSVKQSDDIVVRDGVIKPDSQFVCTSGVHIYDERGNVIGELWIDTDARFYSKILSLYLTEDDVGAAIVNSRCGIVASVRPENNNKDILDVYLHYGGDNVEEWYSQVQSSIQSNERSYFRSIMDGEAYQTYFFPIRHSQYKLLVVKPEKVLYGDVKHFMWTFLAIMIGSVLLSSLCLIYIFFIFKKKNDENTLMENELDFAAEIQHNILPENEYGDLSLPFDIYGFQRPAKSVGGDLYDFVQKGDLLHFCIGDVSGKGMPAALVMTELCSLYRYIISYHSDPCEITTLINKAVMARSDDSMFCTLFVGVLNLKTGLLEFCNAGHNPPIFIDNKNQTVNFLKIKPNMPVYAFENFVYQKESLQLNCGDRVFLYTDGVTESKNDNNAFFGDKATLKTIERVRNLPFNDLINGVLKDLKSFTKKAEQNDDVTMLCVEYKGTKDSVSLHFDKVKENVVEIVNAVLDACEITDNMKFRLAIEEPIQNIADYAYENDGPIDVEINKNSENTNFEIVLIDSGKPFNPLESKLPDLTVPVQQRQIGGLGIYLTRQVMDDFSYEFVNQQNRLKLNYRIK